MHTQDAIKKTSVANITSVLARFRLDPFTLPLCCHILVLAKYTRKPIRASAFGLFGELFPCCQFFKLVETATHEAHPTVSVMGDIASSAVFRTFGCVREIAAAILAERIQRAVTQHAVESFFGNALMAREVIALCVLEEIVLFDSFGYHHALRLHGRHPRQIIVYEKEAGIQRFINWGDCGKAKRSSAFSMRKVNP